MALEFSIEILEVRRQWNDPFKIFSQQYIPRILYPAKLSTKTSAEPIFKYSRAQMIYLPYALSWETTRKCDPLK